MPPRVIQAQRFLARRGFTASHRNPAAARIQALRSRPKSSSATIPDSTPPGSSIWQPLGPIGVLSTSYGLVTGRVSSLALDPSDATGNTLFVGTTGGGVWYSQNAATANAVNVVFQPLTDQVAALSVAEDASISIGAVTVQPGGTGVILAGTGDTNDALDSYYGAGILRSADGGKTWSLIAETQDWQDGDGGQDYGFMGEGFAGFAWSTANPQVVVAAVSQAYEGTLVDAGLGQTSYEGLYYSSDAGVTWHLAEITDGNGTDVQGISDKFALPDGNAATAVVWNQWRGLFIAAVRFHGYYSSPDGITWTRLTAQPGTGLTAALCPTNAGTTGSPDCPIFRGALAVNPLTGDTFAWSVDEDNQDQGIWQDVCGLSSGVCSNGTIAFGTQWGTALLQTNTYLGSATIANGDYNLSLAAVPSNQDTLLLAGANDLWKCSLAMGCVWRNTTNSITCMSAAVGEYQHALAWSATNPLEVFDGNDSGLWRSEDAIGETGSACAASDATHWQNLNGGLGSLAEVESLSAVGTSPYTMMVGLGANGTAGVNSTTGPTADWPEILGGEGGPVAIGPTNANNWYVNNGAGVSIHSCAQGGACTPAEFGAAPAVSNADVGGDGLTMTAPAPFLVDPVDPTKLLIGTCRLWRGPASGSGSNGANWTGANAITPMLGDSSECGGNPLIRSMAAMPLAGGGEVVYVGLYGFLNGGATQPGHILTTTMNASGVWSGWTDLTLNPVTNDEYSFNSFDLDLSSVVIDSHDPSGNTVYVTVAAFPDELPEVRLVYRSIDGGAHWAFLTSNLPFAPVNGLAIDPVDANTVYVATDVGVFATRQVASCGNATANCWNALGTGLPMSPVVALGATPPSVSPNVLVAATYGRGVWQIPLLTAGAQLTTAAASQNSLTFAAQAENASSATQAVTLTNTGGITLTPSLITASGDFSETDKCAGVNVNAGASCSIEVTYSPTQLGNENGSLTIEGNISGGSITINLSGTGVVPPQITLSPPQLNFSQVEVGTTSAALAVSAGNGGGLAVGISSLTVTGPFSVATNSCGTSLAASTDCAISIQFAPVSAGLASGTLTVVDGAGTQTVQLSGTGTALPTDTLTPASLTFPGTIIATPSAAQTVTLTNSGGNPLTGIAVSVSGPFQQSDTCTTQLAPGPGCAINVTFLPTAAGTQTGTLTVSDIVRTQTVPLQGTGLLPPVFSVLPASLAFGGQQVLMTSAPLTLSITNSGGAPMANVGAQITGTSAASFAVGTNTCSALIVGANCSIQVTFTPAATGVAQATLTLTSATQGVTAATVPLGGTGLSPPQLGTAPAQLALAATAIGQTSAAQTVTITNSGGSPAVGLSLAIASPFNLFGNTCGTSLAAGASCTTGVVFAPTQSSPLTGTLTVSATNTTTTATVQLGGSLPSAPGLNVSPTQLTFASTAIAQTSAPQMVTVANSGATAAVALTLTVSGPFSLSGNTCGITLASGASCTVGIAFAPTLTSALTGTLILSSTSVAGTATVLLSGTVPPAAQLSVSPAQLTFAATAIAQISPAQTVIISNPGGTAAAALALAVTGQFDLTANTCGTSLAAGASCTVAVLFAPLQTGPLTGSLTVSSTSVAAPATVALNGTGGLTGALQILPAQANFPTTGLGITSSPLTVTLTNLSASVPLGNLAFTPSAGFQLAGTTCGTSLAAAASCTVGITFAPTSFGGQSGTLTVASSALAANATVPLSGVGFDFTLGGSGSQTVAAGQMATFTLTFAPEGGPGGTFTFQCGGLPQYSGCTINPTSSVVAGNATGSETVQITTGQSSAAQARPATRFGLLPLALAGGLLLLPLASRRGRRIGIALLLVAFVGGVSSCAGSGGGGGGTPPIQPTIDNTPAGTYTIPVTVSANGVQQTVSLTLVVD